MIFVTSDICDLATGTENPNNVLKRVLSTIDKGMRSSATKSTRALVTDICSGCFESYFFGGCTRCMSVC